MVDTNGDGMIDRPEWQHFSEEAASSIMPLLQDGAAGLRGHDVGVPNEDQDATAHDVLEHIPEVVGLGFWPAFLKSLAMIIVTELGDKTFFIAAVLAMKHPRLLIFGGALSALAVMTVLSTAMGYTLPSLLPRSYTHIASAFLFLYFGVRLLYESRDLDDGPSDELREVEEELIHKKDGEELSPSQGPRDEESGAKAQKDAADESAKVFAQSFTITFLAEWGDRSQIATIALASAKDPFGVTVGGVIGHAICTGLAVVGGRILAARISEKTVSVVGGVLFLIFSLHAFVFGPG